LFRERSDEPVVFPSVVVLFFLSFASFSKFGSGVILRF